MRGEKRHLRTPALLRALGLQLLLKGKKAGGGRGVLKGERSRKWAQIVIRVGFDKESACEDRAEVLTALKT